MKQNIIKSWDTIITPNRGWFQISFRDIWKYRDLLWIFVRRDFTVFYKQTILGPLWFFIQPLLSTIVFTVIFNRVAGIGTDQIPPVLFYMSGIIAWNYFSNCLTSTSNTFISNANLFSKVYFPRILIPISQVISGLSRLSIQLIMFFGFYIYFFINGNQHLNLSFQALLLLPLVILQMALLGQGLGMIISSLTTKYRDLNYLVSFGTQLLMYTTPIVYPLSIVPQKYKIFIISNPMSPIIEVFRHALIGKGHLDIKMLLYSFIITIVIFFIGVLIFNKVEKNFLDTV